MYLSCSLGRLRRAVVKSQNLRRWMKMSHRPGVPREQLLHEAEVDAVE